MCHPQVPLTRDAGGKPLSPQRVLVIPKGTLDVSVRPIGNGCPPPCWLPNAIFKRQESGDRREQPHPSKLADYDFRAAVLQAWSAEA